MPTLNIQHLDEAIEIMRRTPIQGFDMEEWRQEDAMGIRDMSEEPPESEQDAHQCGMVACFGGWLALSPEFQRDGGKQWESSGAPIIHGPDGERHLGSEAVAYWLGVSQWTGLALTLTDSDLGHVFYNDVGLVSDIGPQDIIGALEMIRAKHHEKSEEEYYDRDESEYPCDTDNDWED